METNRVFKPIIRYSEAFKLQIVREVEGEGLTVMAVQQRYDIRGCGTVERWVRKYGNGTRLKVIRVETPEEKNELVRLRDRVKRLETALADANLDLALERAYTQIACKQAGIKDVEHFKKKHPGALPTRP
jgi:transposase-like protein